MTKLGAGEALAAAGLILAGITLLDTTGPGYADTLKAHPGDAKVRAHLTHAEATTSITLLLAGVVASVLMRAVWPLLIAAVAAMFAAGAHEMALRSTAG